MSELSSRMKALVQPTLVDFEPYDPNFSETKINLSANENTHAMPEQAKAAVLEALSAVELNRYPDPMANELRAEIAKWHNVSPENVCVGNGGDELLFNFFVGFGGAGRTLLNCPPCFSEYDLFGSIVGTEILNIERDAETFAIDEEAVLKAAEDVNLAIVTTPNNPTGDVVSVDFVDKLCDVCPGIVMVDEAYAEFNNPDYSCEPLLKKHDNLIILHTFSKAFGLAGVRCGYIIAASDIIDVFAAVRQVYSVSSLTQAAALAIVKNREAFRDVIDDIKSERERIIAEISSLEGDGLPIHVWPSESNFYLLRIKNAAEVYKALRDDYSILVRDFSSVPGLKDCLRIAVGTRAENDELLAAIKSLLKGN
jgi:histidinol-phosphate aminotransferase